MKKFCLTSVVIAVIAVIWAKAKCCKKVAVIAIIDIIANNAVSCCKKPAVIAVIAGMFIKKRNYGKKTGVPIYNPLIGIGG